MKKEVLEKEDVIPQLKEGKHKTIHTAIIELHRFLLPTCYNSIIVNRITFLFIGIGIHKTRVGGRSTQSISRATEKHIKFAAATTRPSCT